MKFIKLLTKCLFIVIFSLILYNEMKSVCNLGSLSNRQNYSLPSDSYPQSIAFSPIFNSNLFAAVANSNTNYLSIYSVDQTTGTFTEISSSIGTGGVPSGVAFSPITSGGNLFAAVSNSGGGVTAYSVDQSGNFISINTYNAGSQPSSVAFSPIVNGNLFVAVTNGGTSGSNGVTVYTVDESTGVFSVVGNYTTGGQPSSVAFSPITPNGDLFAAVANYASNNISFYQVDTSTGVFNSLGTYQSSSTASCISVAFSPITTEGNLFVAVANSSFTDNSVTIYQVNTQNLSLDLINTYGAGTSPHGVAFSSVVSESLFLGVANQLSSNISMYSVDQSAGTLTSVANYATNQYPYSIAFSPLTTTGYLFLGTANYGGNNITVYSVETAPIVSITVSSENVCVGSSITLTVVALGGSGSYTYSWTLPDGGTSSDNPLIISSATSSDGGSYQVTVTDSNGCQGIPDPVQITVYSRPEVTIQPSNTFSTCVEESVIFTAVPSGGSGNFAYQWFDSNGDLVNTTNILSADTGTAGVFDYSFQLTDTVTQCAVGVTLIQLTVNPNPTVTISSAPPTACYGGNAILTANVSGGSGSYSYQWLLNGSPIPSAISPTYIANDIIPGTNDGVYQVTVTDTMTTCSTTSSDFTIPVDQVSVTLNTSSTAICQGASITLTANVTSGTPTYSYDWYQNGSPLITTSDNTYTINDLSAGNYTYQVIVTDSNSNPCQGTSNSVQVTVYSLFDLTIQPSVAPSTCVGESITLTAVASGGSGHFAYQWTDSSGTIVSTTSTFSPDTSTAGTFHYNFQVTDTIYGCELVGPIIVKVNPNPTAVLNGISPICLGSSSTLTLTLTGTSPYDVTWSDGVIQSNVTSTVTRTVSPTSTTIYYATVTDNDGCTGVSNNFQVVVNPNPTVTITPNPASVCVGSNITLTAMPLGGSGTYTNYTWTLNGSPVGTNSPTLQISSATLSDAGTYQVTVIDSNGCQAMGTATVSVGEVIVSANSSPSTVCSGNSSTLTAVVTSGLAPYTYQWTGPNGFTSTVNPVTISNITSSNAGIYQVTVTDSNGCQGTATTTIVVDTINVNITGSSTVCLGSTINLSSNVTTGVAPYAYQWTGPNGFTSTSASITISNAQQVNSGLYQVTVTDSNGCQGVASSLVTVDIVSVNVVPSTTTACIGSNVTLTANVTSGTSPYSYSWVGPNGYTSTGNPITISNISLSNSGTYSVIVTDSNNCTGMSSSAVNVSQLSVSVSPSLESVCVGSTITLTANVSGGTTPYSYQWTGPNGFTSTVNPLVINNATLSNAGLYQVTVTDTNNCSGSSSSVVNVGQLSVSIVPVSQSICIGSTITLTANVNGGIEPYSYQWQGPNGFTSNNQNVTINNATLSNAGTYQLTVTDINGCSGVSLATVNVGQLNVLVSPAMEAVCIGSTITLTANPTGGVAPYTYQWSGPNGFISTSNPAIINNATLLDSGAYYVVVTDANGCSGSGSSNISVDQVIVSVSPSNTSVCPGSTVVLTANVTSGVAPYTYQWSGPDGYSFTGNPAVISGISTTNQGVYTVTVIDGNGCSGISTATVEIGELEVQVSPDTLSTCLGATINLTSSVSGGTLPYTYQWTGPNGFTSNNPNIAISNASELNAGTYQLEVTDVNGCSSLGFSTVTINAVNVNIISDSNFFNLVNANAVQNICQGTTITLTAQVTSGNPPFTYQWTGPNGFSSTEQTINIPNAQPVNSGTYRVVVTSCDMSGEVCCTAQSSVDVVVSNISVTVTPSSTSVCPGSTVTLSTNVTGGSAPYTYSWAGPNGFTANTQNITINNVSELTSGVYQVTVTDSNGCVSIGSSQINLEDIVIEIIPNPAVVAPGSAITLRANIVCGQAPFTYQWTGPNGFTSNSPIITINNANGSNTGTYTLTVTDANGNTITETIEIRLDDLSVDIISNTLNVRQGQTIELIAQVSGGQAPYTYQWFGPAVTRSTSGQLISTDQILIVKDATTANSGIYTVIVTDAYGFTASDSVNVTVRATSSLSSAIASKYCS
ncbi:immunoglobulin domain-containing protein [Candidatus Babela massiliensis]|uniref:Immunoglobulin-like repeats containing protein domain n=1 Tax=Candidatus Babela massiliensis TaxID=673862 RepID=V6DIF1_9BACT|nr:immunoglobulin domain-containing protein [Candidatus Babela massiliensis]CDK30306.1 Immunoglobulin-like repeats containing protein domain [Candidatus Babela massiliensis]